MKLKIAIDVDGVAASPYKHFIEEVNARYGTNLNIEDLTWGFINVRNATGLEFEECNILMRELWDKKWNEIELSCPHITDTLENLSKNNKIMIVTANENTKAIEKLIKKNKIKHHDFFHHKEKHELDYDFIIEDNPEHAEKDPDRTILFDRPWNRHIDHKDRVSSFKEVADIIEKRIG